jgi:hypothetical protein
MNKNICTFYTYQYPLMFFFSKSRLKYNTRRVLKIFISLTIINNPYMHIKISFKFENNVYIINLCAYFLLINLHHVLTKYINLISKILA